MAGGLIVVALLAQAVVVDLMPDRDPAPVTASAYVYVDATTTLSIDEITELGEFRRNASGFVNPGTIAGVAWVRIDVRNAANSAGEWVLALNRALLDPGEIYLVTGAGTEQLLASSTAAFARSYGEFGTLAARFALQPGERGRLFVRYRGGNWSGLDLTLVTESTLRRATMTDLLIFFLILGGIGSLVVYGSVSFAFLGGQIMLLYAVAQVALFTFYAHLANVTTVYLWPESPHFGRIVSPVAMALFVTTMVQFARQFFETRVQLPRVDRLLQIYVAAGCLAVVTMPLDYLVPAFDRRLPLYLLYILMPLVWLTLAPLAVYASVKWHHDHWPIAVAWCLMMVFMIALLSTFTGLTSDMPLKKNVYGAVVYLEALFIAMAIALRIRRIRQERAQAEQDLRRSLSAELEATQRSIRLAEEREWAISDLAEKGRLLLAAGHDTRQMLSALQHFSVGLLRAPESERVARAGREIRQIADGLNEVLTTAIEGSSSGGMADNLLALDRVTPAQILTPLVLIHGGAAKDKGVDLRMRATAHPLVTDRVLLARIIGNLVSNALKYTDSGAVLVTCRAGMGRHRFQVFDTGCGLSETALKSLLDPRVGAQHFGDAFDGHGAGFQIAKTLAQRLGVGLHARSTLGRGSVFEVVVPNQVGTSVSISRLVLADADTDQRKVVREFCTRADVELVCAQTDAEVVRLLRVGAQTTLALVDVHFGGTDKGIALCETLSQACEQTTVVLSTYDRSIELRMRAADVCQFVVYKPLSADLIAGVMCRPTGVEGTS